MVALKAAEVGRRYASADQLPPVVLVYGPDYGLVAETASTLAKLAADASGDPLGLVKLGAEELSADPGRIVDEARTIALFGGKRTIWVRGALERAVLPALTVLLEEPPIDAVVIVEMGDLKKPSPLRKAAEASPHAAAIICYADTERDLERLFDGEAKRAGLPVEPAARELALSLIGGDRIASRAEMEKLFLYAHGAERVTVAHVQAIVGDVAEHDAFDAIDAAFLGKIEETVRQLRLLAADGTNPGALAGQALRWCHALERARLDVDRGMAPPRVVERMIPPIFFRKTAASRTLSAWDAARLRRASEWLGEAVLASRRHPATAQARCELAFLRIAEIGKRLAG